MAGEWPDKKTVKFSSKQVPGCRVHLGLFFATCACCSWSWLCVPSQCMYMWRFHALQCFRAKKLNCVQAGRLRRQRSLPSKELVLPL